MKPSELLEEADLVLDFAPTDKWHAIRALVDHLVARGRLPKSRAGEVLEAILSRERSMSTGMEHGIAIPHAAVDEVEGVVAAMGLVRNETGLDFESIDGQRARVVVLLVIPKNQKLLHIRTLADIARVLQKPRVREQLLAAQTTATARAVLVAGERAA
jgi:mannitol/fructose-specific phosphotransferase system IIA component (Ntr-type)